MQLLLDHDVDTELTDSKGQTALEKITYGSVSCYVDVFTHTKLAASVVDILLNKRTAVDLPANSQDLMQIAALANNEPLMGRLRARGTKFIVSPHGWNVFLSFLTNMISGLCGGF